MNIKRNIIFALEARKKNGVAITELDSIIETLIRMGMKIKEWLQSLSFRTGVIVLMCCIPFYNLLFLFTYNTLSSCEETIYLKS